MTPPFPSPKPGREIGPVLARDEAGLPGVAQLEIWICVLIPIVRLVIIRCVDMHPGRPILARRLNIAPAVRNLGEGRRREDGAERLIEWFMVILLTFDAAGPSRRTIMLWLEDALSCRRQV